MPLPDETDAPDVPGTGGPVDAPVTLVSACLAGAACRYDGRALPDADAVAMVEQGRGHAVCPEVAAGLPVPRAAAEIVGGDGHAVLDGRARVLGVDGADHTAAFLRGAARVLAEARTLGVTHAVLQARSPSCGYGVVHDGTFQGGTVPGDGVLAAALVRAGVSVESRRGAVS